MGPLRTLSSNHNQPPLAHSLAERKIRRQQQQQLYLLASNSHLGNYKLDNQNSGNSDNTASDATAFVGMSSTPSPPIITQESPLLSLDRTAAGGTGETVKLRQRQTTLLDYIQVSSKSIKNHSGTSDSNSKYPESLKINHHYQQQQHHHHLSYSEGD